MLLCDGGAFGVETSYIACRRVESVVGLGVIVRDNFDRFHFIQLANAAIGEVWCAEIHNKPALMHSRWMWLKDNHIESK